MSTQQNFDGQIIVIPGVYSNIKSGFQNPPAPTAYGNVLIIDTGSGAGCGGGAGVNGQNTSGKNSLYQFDNLPDFLSFVEKGVWYLLGTPMFQPDAENGIQQPGVNLINYIKAATTTSAYGDIVFGDEASDSVGQRGQVRVQVRSEGLIGNGSLNDEDVLASGYGWIWTKGIVNPNAFVINFYRGTYRGVDPNGQIIGGITEDESTPELLCSSVEFTTVSQLVAWMQTNFNFNEFFRIDMTHTTIPDDDTVSIADYDEYSTSLMLAANGTESYGAQDFLDALTVAGVNLNIDFIFADKWGVNSQHANNIALQEYADNTNKFHPQLYIASGSTESDFQERSIPDAKFYNDQQVTIMHGGSMISQPNNQGFNTYDSYYTAAVSLGREAGLQPQVPLTFKDVAIDGLVHIPNDTEQKQALAAGVLMLKVSDDGSSFEFLKGINSLQNNTFLQNNDGTTYSKQFYRIARQINKTLMINGKAYLKNNPGPNRNTISDTDLLQWTKRQLGALQAQPLADNLLLSYQNIVITRNADAYYTSYQFTPNTEISFLFFTGFTIDVN